MSPESYQTALPRYITLLVPFGSAKIQNLFESNKYKCKNKHTNSNDSNNKKNPQAANMFVQFTHFTKYLKIK